MKIPAPASVSDRRRFLDVEALVACLPVVVLVVVGTMRKGAFFKPDVVVLPCLCFALALVSPPVLRWLAGHPIATIAGVGATAWWLVDAAISKHAVESWRMPATWVCAAAGYGVARALPYAARRMACLAITVIGCAMSVGGLLFIATRSATWTWPDERSLRFQGPLTYPSAIGLYLLVALLASMAVWQGSTRNRTRLPNVVRSLMVLGVVATDSRGALAALLVLLCFRTARHELTPAVVAATIASPLLLYGQRDGVRPLPLLAAALVAMAVAAFPNAKLRTAARVVAAPAVVTAGWLLATQHHAVSGFDASWVERGHILRGAAGVLRRHLLLGAGPDPSIPTVTLSGVPGVDAFAHDEPLEMLLSTGVVGVLVSAASAALVVRDVRRLTGPIGTPLLATVGAAGLVDFVWHFPALGLLCGVVIGATAAGGGTPDVVMAATTSATEPVLLGHDAAGSVRA